MQVYNKPADLKISYKVSSYDKIEEIFDLNEGEQPSLHLMLALMGLRNKKKIELNTSDNGGNLSHEFSLRTVYPRNESDLDAAYGLISILDNLKMPYDEVINKIAFERTGDNNIPFLKMSNVKTFYEYMLSGIDFFEKNFFVDGKDNVNVARNIHDFLTSDQSDIQDTLVELLLEEENQE